MLDVVEPLQQREDGGLAGAGLPDQPNALSGLQPQAEPFEHLQSARILKRDVVEDDGRTTLDQRLGLRVVAQLVRQQQRGNGLGQSRDMLGDIDQRHRKIPRRAENGKPERADQHDIAGGGAAALPKHDPPGKQRDDQRDRDGGVGEPQFLQIAQAAAARGQFPVHGRVEAVMLVMQAAECPHQRHVVDDVDHLAVDGCRLVREIIMQGFARRRQAEHRNHHAARDHDEARGHRQAHCRDQRNGRNRGNAGR